MVGRHLVAKKTGSGIFLPKIRILFEKVNDVDETNKIERRNERNYRNVEWSFGGETKVKAKKTV